MKPRTVTFTCMVSAGAPDELESREAEAGVPCVSRHPLVYFYRECRYVVFQFKSPYP